MKRGGKTRRPAKVFGCVLAVVLGYCLFHVLLVLFPQPLFAHHRTYKHFTVYMREEIPQEITRVLDRVDSLLSASELNDPSLHHEIYIINSYRLSRYLLLRNVHFGCNLAVGHTFITNADVANDIARCELLGPGDQRIRTLSESITHEITHALIRRRIGFGANRRVPAWIKEGYCEHIAQGCPIDYRKGLSLLTGNPSTSVPGLHHLRYRLMIEYLLGEKDMTISELLRQPPDYRTVEAAMLLGLRQDPGAFLSRIGSHISLQPPASNTPR